MTSNEHKKIETNLKRSITRVNNKSKNSMLNLDEKLVLKRKVKELREELRTHVLNYFDLVELS